MQLGIARALVARGHEVRILGGTALRDRVEACGAGFTPFVRAPDISMSSPDTDSVRDWQSKTPIGATIRFRDHLMFGPSLEFATDVIDELDRNPADVVAFDYLLMGAGTGAEKAGVRSAAVIHNPYPLPEPGIPPFGMGLMPARGLPGRIRDRLLQASAERLFKPGLRSLNRARAELGLEPLERYDDQVRRSDLQLVLTSPELDFGSRADLPTSVRYVGPVLDGEKVLRSAEADTAAAEPFIVASLGTTYQRQEALVRRVSQALGGLPVQAILTTGPAMDPGEVEAPDNVEIRRFVPHEEVMPRARLVVCHGGLGTVHAALAHGVPVLCLPHGRDQGDNRARVVAAGAGLGLSRHASVRRIRSAIERALGDDALRQGARRLASSIESLPGAAGAVQELEAIAKR